MADDAASIETIVPITGRRLALPPGPIFALQRAADADYELGAFRAWAGYKDLGCDGATDGLVLFQHVISFGPTEQSGRTGVHCHLAHVHIVIPTSGRGVFSYDGVTTEAVPGEVIVQHGGTVHDQFSYSYAAGSAEENKRTRSVSNRRRRAPRRSRSASSSCSCRAPSPTWRSCRRPTSLTTTKPPAWDQSVPRPPARAMRCRPPTRRPPAITRSPAVPAWKRAIAGPGSPARNWWRPGSSARRPAQCRATMCA
ncbi:MAG: hypothetical protein WDM85_07510 [Caulobacteraceae bacterium]